MSNLILREPRMEIAYDPGPEDAVAVVGFLEEATGRRRRKKIEAIVEGGFILIVAGALGITSGGLPVALGLLVVGGIACLLFVLLPYWSDRRAELRNCTESLRACREASKNQGPRI